VDALASARATWLVIASDAVSLCVGYVYDAYHRIGDVLTFQELHYEATRDACPTSSPSKTVSNMQQGAPWTHRGYAQAAIVVLGVTFATSITPSPRSRPPRRDHKVTCVHCSCIRENTMQLRQRGLAVLTLWQRSAQC
jgi:hypothetical protein